MIYHIIPRQDWFEAQQQGTYKPASLETEGFIHCSEKDQLIGVAGQNFKGIRDLLLLCINKNKLKAEVRYEDLYDSSMLFPHIYGALNLDAVENVFEFPVNEAGGFQLPQDL